MDGDILDSLRAAALDETLPLADRLEAVAVRLAVVAELLLIERGGP